MKKALISVSDKKNIVAFALFLRKKGYEILSTGSTGNYLKQNNINIIPIEEYTGTPEMFDGRVKSLHPKIYGGILYLRNNNGHIKSAKKFAIDPIDIVVVNLYPFEEIALRTGNENELIENIDIGGPTLIRAAAKNFNNVLVVCDPDDYKEVMEKFDDIDVNFRKRYALKTFGLTSYYDGLIFERFNSEASKWIGVPLKLEKPLRYGENPHQKAQFYRNPFKKGIADAIQLHGKELSYNNILDIDTIYRMMPDFEKTTCIIVKHTTPCGVATSDNPKDAYSDALACDPVSAFGGIIGLNDVVDEILAEEIANRFYEVVVAYGFKEKAINILSKKKNLIIIEVKEIKDYSFREIRSVLGGYIIQDTDKEITHKYDVVSKKMPSKNEIRDLEFAFRVAKFAKSNAIVFAKGLKTIAIGSGQTSRIDSLNFASIKAKGFGIDLDGAVMASDGFFPFRDSIDFAHKLGVRAVIEPGGSIKDVDSIKATDEHDMVLLFTNERHFRH